MVQAEIDRLTAAHSEGQAEIDEIMAASAEEVAAAEEKLAADILRLTEKQAVDVKAIEDAAEEEILAMQTAAEEVEAEKDALVKEKAAADVDKAEWEEMMTEEISEVGHCHCRLFPLCSWRRHCLCIVFPLCSWLRRCLSFAVVGGEDRGADRRERQLQRGAERVGAGNQRAEADEDRPGRVFRRVRGDVDGGERERVGAFPLLPFHFISLPFVHCLSLTFHCLSTAFA